jgi:adenine-specific DNA methylase
MAEENYNSEIDFSGNINVEESIDSMLSLIQKKLSVLRNPYIGNKKKMITHIVSAFKKHNIDYSSVLDLFSGSASVSIAFKILGSTIHSNDILTSSIINAIAYVENRNISISAAEKEYLFKTKDIKEPYPFFLKYQDRFTEKEMLFLSNYSNNIQNLFECKMTNPFHKKQICRMDYFREYLNIYSISRIKIALASVSIQNYIMDNCFVGGRLNNGQVLAKLEHRLSHPRNNGREMLFRNIRWIEPLFPEDNHIHYIDNKDALVLLQDIDTVDKLVYIDPPYGGEQSDYVYMYGFFEEYLYQNNFWLGDKYISVEERMRKLKEGAEFFADKKKYRIHFEKLIQLAQFHPQIAISYNDSSWGTLDEICDIVKKYRKSVIVEEFLYNYKYREDKSPAKEYLIISKE